MNRLLRLGKAVADGNRLRILRGLQEGELCVCQIVELLEVSAPTVSRHLSILEAAGLVASRKDGRWVYYRLPAAPDAAARETLDWLATMFAETDNNDADRLAAIRTCGAEETCRRQRKS